MPYIYIYRYVIYMYGDEGFYIQERCRNSGKKQAKKQEVRDDILNKERDECMRVYIYIHIFLYSPQE